MRGNSRSSDDRWERRKLQSWELWTRVGNSGDRRFNSAWFGDIWKEEKEKVSQRRRGRLSGSLIYRTIGSVTCSRAGSRRRTEGRTRRTGACWDRCGWCSFVLRREHWPYTEYHKTYGCPELNSAHRVPRGMHRRISPLCILWSPVCFDTLSTELCLWERTTDEFWSGLGLKLKIHLRTHFARSEKSEIIP